MHLNNLNDITALQLLLMLLLFYYIYMLYSDIGVKSGKYYSVNVPLQDGIDDISYENVFKPIMSKVMDVYCPTG